MSEQPPPQKPKPGSLRDRIAAFEKPSTAPLASPPIPRPKPGALSWKPPAQSPPSSPGLSTDHGSTPEKKVLAGMSASDAKESIGKGGSLKERMAALQGKGGFGAPPPLAPKPALEKPKWKPPPVVSPPSDDEKETELTSHRSDKALPLLENSADQIPQETHDEEPSLAAEDDTDPEEKERQRRAAIAARMARLGGARVGMAPPVFGKKSSIKRTETPMEETQSPKEELTFDRGSERSSLKSPPTEQTPDVTDVERTTDYFPARQDSASSVLSAESTSSSQAARTPSSMPVPAVPRRAAPPRKKVVKSPSPIPEPQILETIVQENPETASADSTTHHDILGEKTREGSKEGEFVIEPPTRALPKVVEEAGHITEERQSVNTLEPEDHHAGDHEEHPGEASAGIEPGTEAQSVVSRDDVAPDNVGKTSSDSAPVMPEAIEEFTAEPEEEDEATRRKRVAARLARMGAFNPLSAPRRQSSITLEDPKAGPVGPGDVPSPTASPRSLRKDSMDSVASKSHWREGVELRKSSIDLGRQSVPPPPPRADNLRTSSVGSTGSPPHLPVGPDSTTPIKIETPPQNDSTESNLPKEDDESQDEFKGLDGEREVGASYDEYEIREQHESGVANEQWEVNDAETEFSSDDASDANQSHSNDQGDDSENDISRITRVLPPRPNANTRPNVVPVPGEPSRPIVPRASAGSFTSIGVRRSISSSQEHEGQQDDKGPSASPSIRHIPPPAISEEEYTRRSETKPVFLNRSLPPPPRILPYSPEDDYQSESEPKPVPLPRSSRTSRIPRPVSYRPEEDFRTDTDSAARPRRSIPPPPEEDEAQKILDDDASSQEGEEQEGEGEEEILPTPPPRRPLPPSHILQEEVTHIPPTRKSTLDLETEELISTISAPSVRRALPSAPSPESRRLVPPPVQEHSIYQTRSSVSVESQEVLDESEGDPIDPAFHSPSRKGSPVNTTPPHPVVPLAPEPSVETEEDSSQTQRRTIADRMAKLGGIKFGAPPPIGRPPVQRPDDNTPDHPIPEEEASPERVQTDEDEEVARKQRIAAKLASMGGQRFGMLPLGPSGALPPQPHAKRPESGVSSQVILPPPSPLRAAPSRPVPPPQLQDTDSEYDSVPSEDGVQVEAEESELEEVSHEDAQDEEETPPPLPTRAGRSSVSESRTEEPRKLSNPLPVAGGRPPVPAIPQNFLNRRSSIQSKSPILRSVGSGFGQNLPSQRPPSFVMVDDPASFEQEEEVPPPPPARPMSWVPPPRGASLPGSNSIDMTVSQWELPSIPVSSLDFGDDSVDLSLSSWTEVGPSAPPPKPTLASASQLPPGPSSKAPSAQLSSDDLMAVWGRVGVQICEVATTLHEKSKKSLVGDGSYQGFVDAVLSQVPNAALPSPPSYGYLVYVQVGSSVQKRASEIMPGDIVMLSDAKFKGHKGIQTYHQNVGAEEPLVGIVNEFEPKKSKIKVFEANQHVGQQTVESISYRLEDMKSGSVKIFRVLEA